MCMYPNQYYSYPHQPAWGLQSAPFDPVPLPSASTMALQEIVDGQQRTTNGLVSLLSEERTSNERSTRDNKQQINNLVSLSQNFLWSMPDVEQKFAALENSIRVNCKNADNDELQDRVNDMADVVSNLRRIAESFACSTGLRLVPGLAPNQWGWVPGTTPPLQQDHTSFSSTFPQAPHIFPTVIPNSTRSSFGHSNPARSVHWANDLDAPPTSYSGPYYDPYSTGPYSTGNLPSAYSYSRTSLGEGPRLRTFSGLSPPSTIPVPPYPPYMVPAPSDPSSPYTPMTGQFGPRSPVPIPQMPSGCRSFPLSVPIVESSHLQRSALSPQPASTRSPTESVGSMHRTRLSPISESRTPSPTVPPLPAFGGTLGGASPSTSTIGTFSTPSGPTPHPNAPQTSVVTTPRVRSESVAPNDPTRQAFLDMMYPSVPSSNASSFDDFTTSPPPRVEIPLNRSIETVSWSSLFPSAPVLVRPPHLATVSSVDETVSSMSSPTRSIICYTDSPKFSSPSEPMTPLSRVSGEQTPGAVPTKLTTDVVDNPKESGEPVLSSVTVGAKAQAIASTSNTSSTSLPSRNQLSIQLVSFFLESLQRVFKVPSSVDLTYKGFEVSFSTESIPWKDGSVVDVLADEDSEHDRNFEMMPAPSNAALHRYIRDLARVRMDLAAMQDGEKESKDQGIVQLELRVKAEQEATQNWIRRVCKAAGALSIVDAAFSPRK